MAKSDFSCGRNAFFFGSRFYSAVLSSQVPKKCTDLDLSLLYNLILGTYSKFARKNNFLSLCARRSHRRAALLRTLRWLSKFSKKDSSRVSEKASRGLETTSHFPIRHHELFLLRSRSDFHVGNCYDYVANVANFWEHSRIRSSWFNSKRLQSVVGMLHSWQRWKDCWRLVARIQEFDSRSVPCIYIMWWQICTGPLFGFMIVFKKKSKYWNIWYYSW